MLGPDLYNGTSAQLAEFGSHTGATYPLLLLGGLGSGNENLFIPYGSYDNYAVINKQGILRYLAYDHWPHGNRYHLNEIRGCIDSLVSSTVGVGDGPTALDLTLEAAPNPFRGGTTFTLINPSDRDQDARLEVHDLSGRRIVTLWAAPVSRGMTRISWDGRTEQGLEAAPGLYLVHARVGKLELTRRVVRLK